MMVYEIFRNRLFNLVAFIALAVLDEEEALEGVEVSDLDVRGQIRAESVTLQVDTRLPGQDCYVQTAVLV